MTTVAPKQHNDADRITAISEKFLENEDLTGLIDEIASRRVPHKPGIPRERRRDLARQRLEFLGCEVTQ